jgi:hypothetical protein
VPSRQAAREGEELPRVLTILFPNGTREYWLTELVFEPGAKIQRNGSAWAVVSVSGGNAAGKHMMVRVRPDRDAQPVA